jgi:hypothetical protein
MTWNVAGHSPLDPDEALPQLCFVAHSMMSRGEQRISRAELRRRLTTARNEMSNLLGFARVGVAELIELVEQRSGLLVDTGPDIFEGELIDSYEFRHLTFQEYLTAKALVEGWYEARQPQDNLITTLQAHFKDERWREVIPLAAAIGGRGAERLVWALTGECHPDNAYGRGSPNVQFVATALANCLADEAPVAQKGAEEAVYALIANAGGTWLTESIARRILNSKYGELFAAKARQSFLDCKPDFGNAASALAKSVPEADATLCRASRRLTASPTIHALIDGNDRAARCVGALSFTQIAKELGQETLRTYDSHHEVVAAFAKMISSADHAEQFAGCWAIGALHTDSLHESSKREELSNVLHVLARESPHSEVRAAAASACARFGAVRS